MVQKKIPQKLIVFQPDHDVKDIKGPDLKKMKRSGSIKRQEHFKQPGKPKPPPPATTSPPCSTPNYMKSTTSSDARKEVSPNNSKFTLASATNSKATKTTKTLTKSPTIKPSSASSSIRKKCSQVVFCQNLDSQRSTCSSTLKDSKFPAYLSLNPGATESQGTSIVKVCPYTYCSLNGHRHAPLLPLKCFLSARRRVIKAQRSVKLGCASPRRLVKDDSKSPRVIISPLTDEEESGDFFIDIYSKRNEGDDINGSVDHQGNDVVPQPGSVQEETKQGFLSELQVENVQLGEQDVFEVSDMEWETEGSDIKSDIDGSEVVESHHVIDDDELMIETEKKGDGWFDEFQSDQVSQESFDDEERFNSDMFSYSDEDGDSTNSYSYPMILNNMENFLAPNELSDVKVQENSTRSDSRVALLKKAETENEDRAKVVLTITKCNKPVEDMDESGAFNPRAPNFLLLEPDPEAEKVDLKHQDLDVRKNAEEWMVDYALRQMVTKLDSARKRKVALLVEAFEKVTPEKKCELQLRHASAFDQARPSRPAADISETGGIREVIVPQMCFYLCCYKFRGSSLMVWFV